jgi:hypothetical protein
MLEEQRALVAAVEQTLRRLIAEPTKNKLVKVVERRKTKSKRELGTYDGINKIR